MWNWEHNFYLERQISQDTNSILIVSVFNGQIFDTLVSFLYFSWEKFPDNELHKLFPTILKKKSYLFILYVIIPLDASYFLSHENKEIIIPKLPSLCDTELTAFVIISVIFSKMKNLYDWKIWLRPLPSSYPSHIYSLHWLVCQHLVYLQHKNALSEFFQLFSNISNIRITAYLPKCIQRPSYNKFRTFSLNAKC